MNIQNSLISLCAIYIILGVYQAYIGDKANSSTFAIMSVVVFTGAMVIKAIKENK